MKRLCDNIEDVHIKGSIGQLSEMVTQMDMILQEISNKTDFVYSYLAKNSNSNAGKQYEKVVNASILLRDYLYDASYDLNDLQNQLVDYQNKIARYEDLNDSAARNPHLVNKTQNINANTTIVQIQKNEMIQLVNLLKGYSNYIINKTKEINHRKEEIGNIWLDSQYRDFSEFINDIIRKIGESLKEFDQYIQYLDEKIKEL